MIQRLKHNIIFKILWGLMNIHLINISIDNPDPYMISHVERNALNEQESFVEIILEKLLEIDDAISEYEEPDTEEKMNAKGINILCLIPDKINPVILPPAYNHTQLPKGFYASSIQDDIPEVSTPPPESGI